MKNLNIRSILTLCIIWGALFYASWFGDFMGTLWLRYMMHVNKERLLLELEGDSMAYSDFLYQAQASIGYAVGALMAIILYLSARRLHLFGLGPRAS